MIRMVEHAAQFTGISIVYQIYAMHVATYVSRAKNDGLVMSKSGLVYKYIIFTTIK